MTPVPHEMRGVAFITGAASGIGRACARTFVKEGCTQLILGDLSGDLEQVAQELVLLDARVATVLVKADVSSLEDVERMMGEGIKRFGAIHYAVNCAGITSNPRVRTHEMPTESWDRVNDVNIRGLWFCERAQIQQMMKQAADLKMRTGATPQRGAIVNISSIFATVTHPTVGSYSASKCGVIGLTRTDAVAYAADGIRVNAVSPGFTKTALAEESIRRGADYESMISSIPIKRWGSPDEIAEACVFLCSEKASLITGIDVRVDGGKCVAV